MMETSHRYLTRSELILHYVRRMTRETPPSVEDYSEDVLRIWLERTPAEARSADLKADGAVFDRMKANGLKIRRWMNPDVAARPPIDVEESLVLALPQPYRGECLRDLAARYEGLFVPLPAGAAMMGCAGELLQEVGESCQALAPLLADGRIDEHDDAAALLRARQALLDVQSVTAGILMRLDNAIDQRRKREQQEAQSNPLRAVR